MTLSDLGQHPLIQWLILIGSAERGTLISSILLTLVMMLVLLVVELVGKRGLFGKGIRCWILLSFPVTLVPGRCTFNIELRSKQASDYFIWATLT